MAAVEAGVRTVYGTYMMSAQQMSESDIEGVMDRRIYSADLKRIIAAWTAANPGPEPTEFASADWICGCQDWDAGNTSLRIGEVRADEGGRYRATATFQPGFDAPPVTTQFLMIEENGRWLVDDASFGDGRPTLRQSLVAETRSPG